MPEPTKDELRTEIELTKKKDINQKIQTQLDELLNLVNQNAMNDVKILYSVLKINIDYYNIKKKYLSFPDFLNYFESKDYKDYKGLYIFILFLNKNKDQEFLSFNEFTYKPEQRNIYKWQALKNGIRKRTSRPREGRGAIDDLIFFFDRINFYHSYFQQYNEVYPNLGFKDPYLWGENVIEYFLRVLEKLTQFLENVNEFQSIPQYQELIEILRSLSLIPETQLKKDEKITINTYEKLCKCIDNNKNRNAAGSMVHIYEIDKWFRETYKYNFNFFVSQRLVECFDLFIFVPFFYTRLEVPDYNEKLVKSNITKFKQQQLPMQSSKFFEELDTIKAIIENRKKFYPENETEKQVNESKLKKAQSLLILISLIPYGKTK
jgi:hypothetical protein